jgi:hypothetical protein
LACSGAGCVNNVIVYQNSTKSVLDILDVSVCGGVKVAQVRQHSMPIHGATDYLACSNRPSVLYCPAQIVFNAGLQMRQTKMEIDLIGFGATLPNIGLYVNASFRINKYALFMVHQQYGVAGCSRPLLFLPLARPMLRCRPRSARTAPLGA